MAGRSVALITDTHFGVKKGSQFFHEYYENFYRGTFFPELDRRGIKHLVHLGDCFDTRKAIDYWSLDWAKKNFFDPLKERGIEVHLIVGNHDSFYKNTISINSPSLNLREYDNVHVYDRPQTTKVNNSLLFMVPWICDDNAEQFLEQLELTDATLCFGHLELAGFYANKDYKCEHGTDPDIFNKFDRVFSGHFHKRSTNGNITYLGNPYQLYWNDEGDKRGFHILDLDTNELEFICNPNTMYHKVFCRPDKKMQYKRYQGSIVKLILEESCSPVMVSNWVDKLFDAGVHDVKVIENVDISIDDDVEVESEDTLTTLTNYVQAMEGEFSREHVIEIFKSLYVESQEV